MSAYVLSPRAREDLREIWRYAAERWDIDRANRYIRELHRAFNTIADDPRRGRPCDHLRAGYRKFPASAHMLFFRVAGNEIVIMRVLHQSMDFERHL